jgi:hypothetical protein
VIFEALTDFVEDRFIAKKGVIYDLEPASIVQKFIGNGWAKIPGEEAKPLEISKVVEIQPDSVEQDQAAADAVVHP